MLLNVVRIDSDAEQTTLGIQKSEGTVLLEGVDLQLALFAIETDGPAESRRFACKKTQKYLAVATASAEQDTLNGQISTLETEWRTLQRTGHSSETHLSEGLCTRPEARGSCSFVASCDLRDSLLYISSHRSSAETRRRSDYGNAYIRCHLRG